MDDEQDELAKKQAAIAKALEPIQGRLAKLQGDLNKQEEGRIEAEGQAIRRTPPSSGQNVDERLKTTLDYIGREFITTENQTKTLAGRSIGDQLRNAGFSEQDVKTIRSQQLDAMAHTAEAHAFRTFFDKHPIIGDGDVAQNERPTSGLPAKQGSRQVGN